MGRTGPEFTVANQRARLREAGAKSPAELIRRALDMADRSFCEERECIAAALLLELGLEDDDGR